jgi:hypothetical protein
MEALYKSYISWFEFAALVILIYFIYVLIKRNKETVSWITGLHNMSLINSILGIFLVILFILINPTIHGILVLIGLALFYQVLTSYIKGVIVTTNSKVEEGDLIQIGNFKGKVAGINLAGIQLLNEKNNLFVPYKIISAQVIEKLKSGQSSYMNFRCKPLDETKDRRLVHDLEKAIFNFPFLDTQSKIEIKQHGYEYEVHLTLANDRFSESLLNQINKAGFSIINQKNS